MFNNELTFASKDNIKCLTENQGKVLTRQILLDSVWGFDFEGDQRTLDTHSRRLREKIGEDLIKTYRGLGYGIDGVVR